MAFDFLYNIAHYFFEKCLMFLVERLWNKFEPHYDSTKKIAAGILIAFNVICISLCLSSFMFGTMYFYQMPTVYHSIPLNFIYNRSCIENHKYYESNVKYLSRNLYVEECYPTAQVLLSSPKQHKLLQEGQVYSVVIHLELPETSTNRELGMFMVKMVINGRSPQLNDEKNFGPAEKFGTHRQKNSWFYGRTGDQFSYKSTRSTSMQYKSFIIRCLKTLAFWPLYLLDAKEETQNLEIVLFKNLLLDKKSFHWTGTINVDHPAIMIKSAYIDVTAEFKGIQYLMYKWPILSFLSGTSILFAPVLFMVTMIAYLAIWRPLFPSVAPNPPSRSRHLGRTQTTSQTPPNTSFNSPEDSNNVNPSDSPPNDSEPASRSQTISRRSSTSSCSIEMIGQSQESPMEESQSSFVIAPGSDKVDAKESLEDERHSDQANLSDIDPNGQQEKSTQLRHRQLR